MAQSPPGKTVLALSIKEVRSEKSGRGGPLELWKPHWQMRTVGMSQTPAASGIEIGEPLSLRYLSQQPARSQLRTLTIGRLT